MNVLQTPSHVNKDSYNVIPMEQRTEFTSTVGELLPVYYDILYPGEKVTINNVLRTRTMDLNSAAFCHLVEHVDWFAVPLDQLYQVFSNWFMGINDLKSDFYADTFLADSLPLISANAMNTAFPVMGVAADKYFPSLRGTSLRLMELLGIPLKAYGGLGAPVFPMSLSPMLPAAYQKIYMDYYRLSDREANDPTAYNFDSFAYLSNFATERIQKLFTLRYRPYNKDFFTHLYTSPLMGVDSLGAWPSGVETGNVSPLVNQFHQWLTSQSGIDVATYGSDKVLDQETPSFNTLSNPFDYRDTEAFEITPASIRTSFAVEKLLEITRRAGKHVDQQLLAHFGVKVSSKVAGEVEKIGSMSSEIMIGDVIATAASESNSFGQVGGKGYGSGNGKLKWKNDYPCPVIIMAIYSCNPDTDYSVTGLDRLNTYHQNADFFHPEFNNLGMQPQFGYQRRLYGTGDDYATKNAEVLGWQYRWMELKCKSNRVCGNLARTLSFWTTRRATLDDNNSISNFLVNPNYLDTIMQKTYDYGSDLPETVQLWGNALVEPWDYSETFLPSHLFDSDPLIHEFYVHCNKATKMSTFGLPSL